MVSAQEATAVSKRPAETELLFNETPVDAEGFQSSEANEMPGVGFGDFLRVIIVLAVVIAIIYFFVWMLKKFTGIKAEGGDAIRLYSTMPLKGDAALHLVEAGNKIFLIGSSGNSINLISEINEKESIDEIRMNASLVPKETASGFARLFKDKFGVANTETPKNESEDSDPVSFLRKQRERLKDL